jgi:hypothetical protein
VKESIEKFGLVFPILITPDGAVIDGRMRIDICEQLGLEFEPVIWDIGNDLTLAHIIAEVDNTGRASRGDVDLTEQVEHLMGRYDPPIVAAALGISIETTVAIMADINGPRGEEEPSRESEVVEYIEHHEALAFMPEVAGDAYEALKRDIRDNGQKEPILLSREGVLVDGRARWNICHELGITPVTRTVRGNCWEQCLIANEPRITDPMDRLMLAAKLPGRTGGTVINDQRPPSSEFTCETLKVPYGTVKPLRTVALRPGGNLLLDAVRERKIKPGTARRIMNTVKSEDWPKAIRQVEVAAATGGVRHGLPEFPDEVRRRASRGPITASQDRDRNRFVTAMHIRQAIDNLVALDTVVNGTVELEPGITDDQAADLLRDRRRHARRPTTRMRSLPMRVRSSSVSCGCGKATGRRMRI